jgi:hypothetical protein
LWVAEVAVHLQLPTLPAEVEVVVEVVLFMLVL